MRSASFGAAHGLSLRACRQLLTVLACVVAGCATGSSNGSGGDNDASTDASLDGVATETSSDGAIDASSDASSGEIGDGADDADDGSTSRGDVGIGDATLSDLLTVCVLGSGGATSPCLPSGTLDFGVVGATATVQRLVRFNNTSPVSIDVVSVQTDVTSFIVTTVLYNDVAGVLTRVPQSLPYSIPSGQALYAEVVIVGSSTLSGALPASVLRLKGTVESEPIEEVDVPITGEYSTCPAGEASCDPDPTKVCTTDVYNDLGNCGGCGKVCAVPNGTAACVTGICTNTACQTNYADCDGLITDGCEVNVYNDPSNCGACGKSCLRANTDAFCNGGNCNVKGCSPGYADCNLDPSDGCETDVDTSAANCGGCNIPCAYANAGSTCTSGVCNFLGCDPNYVDCNKSLADGCEVDTQTDPNNCGFCGNGCSYANATALCTTGTCAMGPCTAGFEDCDGNPANGCESYAPTDPSNCGGCGNSCQAKYPNGSVNCAADTCQFLGCQTGFYDKDGDPTNGCEYGSPTDLLQLCVFPGVGTPSAPMTITTTTACSTSKVLAFGSINPGVVETGIFRYTNIGPDDIVIDSSSIPSTAFAIVTARYEVDPGGSGDLLRVVQPLPFTVHAGKALYFEITLTAGATSAALPATSVSTSAHMFTEADEVLTVTMSGDELGCPSGKANCSGDISKGCDTTVSTDPNNCGTCGTACAVPNATSICASGTCQLVVCLPGFADCNGIQSDGCEVNLNTDPTHCGSCTNVCSTVDASETCVLGSCTVSTCTAPFADCDKIASDGCEVDTSSSLGNCGGCGAACAPANATGVCTSSSCEIATCNAGYADCDTLPGNGCEVHTASDVANCGTCDNVCSFANATPLCGATGCAMGACNANFGDCNANTADGCEDYLPTDSNNCGACGNNCGTDFPHTNASCASSVCNWTACATGYTDKDGNHANGCEWASPVGFLSVCVLNAEGATGACASPASLDFGSIQPGTTPLRLFKLTNNGDQPVSIDAVKADAAAFTFGTVLYIADPGGGTGLVRVPEALAYTMQPGTTFFVETSILGTAAAGALPASTVRVTAHIGTESSEEVDVAMIGNMAGCAAGTASCDGSDANGCEVNTNTDNGNCGACTKVCAYTNAAAQCVGGSCQFLGCTAAFQDCDGNLANGCESNGQSDNKNCGSCANSCAVANTTTQCNAGSCSIVSCTAGYTDCDGKESNGCEVLTGGSDNGNCGGCATVCAPANATAACTTGTCKVGSCNAGFVDCDKVASNGCEINTTDDPANCGGCGNSCAVANTAETCVASACTVTGCAGTFMDCDKLAADGCEVDTSSSLANCGGCGAACAPANATGACSASSCSIASCNAGYKDCDGLEATGCEIHTDDDTGNCGKCGTICSYANATPLCTTGACSMGACNSGFDDCNSNPIDGCEVYLPSDGNNCGACNNNCLTDFPHTNATCAASACNWTECQTGYTNKDGNHANGCEWASPIGFLGVCVLDAEGPTGACVSPASLNFGTIQPGTTPTLLFKLTNNGDQPVSIDTVKADSTAFTFGTVVYITNPGGPGLVRVPEPLAYSLAAGASFYVETSIVGATTAGALPANTVRVTAHIGTESSEEVDVAMIGTFAGCAAGTADCDGKASNGCEVNTNTDNSNCGACSKGCAYTNAGAQCTGGVCNFTGCVSPYQNCNGTLADGCESNSTSDPLNCSACTDSCAVANTNTTCSSSTCSITSCATGYKDCDGKESNGCEVLVGGADNNNCGGCGTKCALTNAIAQCTGGACDFVACTAPYSNCGGSTASGCTIDLATDLNNCVSCGNKCSYANAAALCESTGCAMGACATGYLDCDKNPTNGCEVTPATDVNNCGGCGTKCSTTYPNASVSCVGTGTCQWNGCDSGWVDLKGNHTCSYACTVTSSIDLPDLGFVDANCDGIDGDPTKAIFVSPTGSDTTGTGTMASPVKTLAHALALASAASPKKNVYADKGTYNEEVTLVAGVGLYGGYDSTNGWSRSLSNESWIESPASTGVYASGIAAATEIQLFTVSSMTPSSAGASSYGFQINNSSGPITINGCTIDPGSGVAGTSLTGSGAASSGSGGNGASGQNPGTLTCPQGAVSGGGGGASVSGSQSGIAGTQGDSVSGGGSPGAQGGRGAKYGVCDSSGTSGDTGGTGGGGGNGNGGGDGAAPAALGTLSGATYTPINGNVGAGGWPGGGGGGGGSGGGDSDACGFADLSCCNQTSGYGGGGGSGGCGGSGGGAGGSGGGSIGIALSSSTVTIESCTFHMGNGGAGGGGQAGGPGGSGAGGTGGGGHSGDAGNGGPGGAGGSGGHGGGGSGGAGGPSFCVLYSSGTTPNYSKTIPTENNCYLGTPGTAGKGQGLSNNGPGGLSLELQPD